MSSGISPPGAPGSPLVSGNEMHNIMSANGSMDGIGVEQTTTALPANSTTPNPIDSNILLGKGSDVKKQHIITHDQRSERSSSLGSASEDGASYFREVGDSPNQEPYNGENDNSVTTPLLKTPTSFSPTATEKTGSTSSSNTKTWFEYLWGPGTKQNDNASLATNKKPASVQITSSTAVSPTSRQLITSEQIPKATPEQLLAFTNQFKTDVPPSGITGLTGKKLQEKIEIFEAIANRISTLSTYHALIKTFNRQYNLNNNLENNFRLIQDSKLSEEHYAFLEQAKQHLIEIFSALGKVTLSNEEEGSALLKNPYNGKNFDVIYKPIQDIVWNNCLSTLNPILQEAVKKFPNNTFYSESCKYVVDTIKSLEGERIVAVLANKEALGKILSSNPENAKSTVNTLDSLSRADPYLIITPNSAAEGKGEEKKSASSFMRFQHWLSRSKKDQARYRGGIMAARNHVESKYGPYAVNRFDAHFALRYRKGSPLTVRALNEFLNNEKELIATETDSGLASSETGRKFSNAVVSVDTTTNTDDFLQESLFGAKCEFQLRYYDREGSTLKRPSRMSEQDETVLFANFYQHYLKRPVAIKESVPVIIGGRKEFWGFVTTRWSAAWTSLFPGDNSQANENLQNKLTDWIVDKLPVASKTTTKKAIRDLIELKLETQDRLTLQDLNDLIEEAANISPLHDTWSNRLFYNCYKPLVSGAAMLAAAGAGAALIASDSSLGRGVVKAAALGAALYALDDRPGMQLSTALAAWWAAKHPAEVESGLSSVVGGFTSTAKHAAIFYAGLHFPPLWLLHLA